MLAQHFSFFQIHLLFLPVVVVGGGFWDGLRGLRYFRLGISVLFLIYFWGRQTASQATESLVKLLYLGVLVHVARSIQSQIDKNKYKNKNKKAIRLPRPHTSKFTPEFSNLVTRHPDTIENCK